MLELKNINKSINGNEILKNLNMTIEEGQIVGVIGKSGSGKSTLLRTIAGLEGLDSGDIIYKGENITTKKSFEKRKDIAYEIGMVFQHFNLFTHWSVLENVYKTLVIVKKMPKQQAIDLAVEALKSVGLGEFIERELSSLSGGQKQRVAIARTLAMQNKVILFDEATSALDPQSSKDIMNVMMNLKNEHKVTMVIVSHELGFIRDICDYIYYMQEGEIVEQGATKDIFSAPKDEKTQQFLADFIEQ